MNLIDQVCSLELAKELEKLGIKQESLFYWADGSLVSSIDMDLLLINNKVRTFSANHNDYPDEDVFNLYSAFTVSELGEMLPDLTKTIKRKTNDWVCIVTCKDSNQDEHFVAFTEANVRAIALICLIENKLMEIPKCSTN